MTNHVHGYPDNEQEWLDMLLGRGPGDIDMIGYPEASPAPKGQSQNKNTTQAPTSQTSTITQLKNYTGRSNKQ